MSAKRASKNPRKRNRRPDAPQPFRKGDLAAAVEKQLSADLQNGVHGETVPLAAEYVEAVQKLQRLERDRTPEGRTLKRHPRTAV